MAVVVLGAGRMGSQIGAEYALGGHDVTWVVRDGGRAAAAVEAAFAVAESTALWTAAEVTGARDRTHVATALRAAGAGVELVAESVAEDLAVKGPLLRAAAERWPEAILATNTSSLRIADLGEAAGAPERTIGAHWWNPPLLMPLVEVVPAAQTGAEAVERTMGLLRALGKRPVLIARDVPGFAWNRLQFALLREALWLVQEGVVTPEVVDEIVRDGLARRWRLTGPFETAQLGGPETFAAVAANLFGELSQAADAAALTTWPKEDEATLAALRRRRDESLIAALRADAAAGS
jgi:3-hydroxybutyryl-CoA dehydrogenase